MTQWKVGDWVVFDRSIGQIKELREGNCATFSDGVFETSGNLTDRFRPLTLRNKRIVETFEIYYERLGQINGDAGFNYPRISSYFSGLALKAIDDDENRMYFELAKQFVEDAREYKPRIQGIALFRPKVSNE